MQIEDQSRGMFPVEMQPIDAYSFGDVEEQLPEWDIVFVLEVGRQLFRLEDKFVLYEVSNDKQDDSTNDYI